MEITQIVNPFIVGTPSGNGGRIALVIFIVIAIAGVWYYYKSKNTANNI